MPTNFNAISEKAKRAAAERQMDSRDAASYAAGYEIGLLQQIIIDLETRLAGDKPSESRAGAYDIEGSQAQQLTNAIDSALTDGEVCTDAIYDALVNDLPIEFDGRFTLEDGSVWSVQMHVTARTHTGAAPQGCWRCAGSGEGMTEASCCSICGGSGTIDVD